MDALSPPAVSAAMLLLGSAQAFIVPTSITSTTAAQRLPASAMRRDAVRVFAQLGTSEASVAQQGTAPLHHWMDHLKFEGSSPSFDVIARTKEYIAATAASEGKNDAGTEYFADDYVFRGSVIGPITNRDVVETQRDFNLVQAYPDLDRGIFGFTIDPENAYRCLFFERWTGTNTGPIKIGKWITLPPSGKRVEAPIHVSSITWNPDGKIVYQCISPPLDRFEGNTKGAGAVFALLAGAGLQLPAGVGDVGLMMQQKMNTDVLGGLFGKTWSSDAEIPAWWKSQARGAEPNDL